MDSEWLETFADYLQGRVDDGIGSAATVRGYLSDVRIYAGWFMRVNGVAFEPQMLTNTDLRQFRKWTLAQDVSAATWNRRLATLRVLWRWAVREGLVGTWDIFDGIETRDVGELKPKWLGEGEFNRLKRWLEQQRNVATTEAAKAQALRNWAVFGLMAWAGLREAEVCALCVGDVELGERSGAVVVRCGKGRKGRRVPLNSEARSAIRGWLAVRQGEGEWLFFNQRGDPMGVNAVQEFIGQAGMRCGVGHVTPHQLRHTFCKRVLSANYERLGDKALLTVAQMAGHARLDTTRRYVVMSDAEMLDVVEGI